MGILDWANNEDKKFKNVFEEKHSRRDSKKIVKNDPRYKSMDKKKNKKEARENRKNNS